MIVDPAVIAGEILDDVKFGTDLSHDIGGWVAVGKWKDKWRAVYLPPTPGSTAGKISLKDDLHRIHYIANADSLGPWVGHNGVAALDRWLGQAAIPEDMDVDRLRDVVASHCETDPPDEEEDHPTILKESAEVELFIVDNQVVAQTESPELRNFILNAMIQLVERIAR